MPFFSIIIPFYNIGETIIPLLESLKNQKYKNFELILVDDGSDDNSKSIVYRFKNEFSDFKYILKKNGGTSSARNLGLSYANGEYILFADADDTYEEDALNIIFNSIKMNSSELICFDYYNLYLGGKKESALNLVEGKINLDVEKVITNFLNYNYINRFASAVWNKVYKKNIIDKNKLEFNEDLVLGEDLFFNINYFCNVQCIDLIDYKLYNYLQTENSIMRSYRKNNVELIKNYIPILFDLINSYNCENLEYLIHDFYISNFFGIISNELKNKSYQNGKNKIDDYCSQIDKFKKKNVLKMSIKNLVYFLLIKTSIWKLVYFVMYKIKGEE